MIYLSFFFLLDTDLPHLHSFPTRRSSDLIGQAEGHEVLPRLAGQPVVPHDMVRSEEHTSELQSHSDLVCRLLLEKKKSALTPGAARPRPTCTRPRTWEARKPKREARSIMI